MSVSRTRFIVALAFVLTCGSAIAQDEVKTSQIAEGLDVAAVGAFGSEEARMPSNIWSGSDRAVVAQLVSDLPVRISSPTLADVTRRVLAVAAEPPAGDQLVPNFAYVRANALLRIGHADLAARIISGLPRAGRQEESDITLVKANLLTRDVAGSCEVARERVGRAKSSIFAKVNAFCDVLSGDISRAHFSAALVAELAPEDSAYFELLGLLFHEGAKPGPAIGNLINPSPLHRAMLATAGLSPEILPAGGLPDPFSEDAVAVEMLLATDPIASPTLRQEAGQYSILANALKIEDARQLVMVAGAPNAPFGLAEVVRISSGPERAIAMGQFLDIARNSAAAATMAKLALPILTNIPMTDISPEIGGKVARGLVLAAAPDMAKGWLDQLEADSASEELVKFSQVFAIAAGRDLKPFTGEEALVWVKAMDPASIAEKASLLGLLRRSVGLTTSPVLEAIGLVTDVKSTIPPSDLMPLEVAGAEKLVGETILRAVKFVSSGAQSDQPLRLAAASKALFEVGLIEEARLIAAEAAVMGGL
ncbi:MAG: hypothetical protein ACO23H_17550 [Alphaproteobacteria bacterium]